MRTGLAFSTLDASVRSATCEQSFLLHGAVKIFFFEARRQNDVDVCSTASTVKRASGGRYCLFRGAEPAWRLGKDLLATVMHKNAGRLPVLVHLATRG